MFLASWEEDPKKVSGVIWTWIHTLSSQRKLGELQLSTLLMVSSNKKSPPPHRQQVDASSQRKEALLTWGEWGCCHDNYGECFIRWLHWMLCGASGLCGPSWNSGKLNGVCQPSNHRKTWLLWSPKCNPGRYTPLTLMLASVSRQINSSPCVCTEGPGTPFSCTRCWMSSLRKPVVLCIDCLDDVLSAERPETHPRPGGRVTDLGIEAGQYLVRDFRCYLSKIFLFPFVQILLLHNLR